MYCVILQESWLEALLLTDEYMSFNINFVNHKKCSYTQASMVGLYHVNYCLSIKAV